MLFGIFKRKKKNKVKRRPASIDVTDRVLELSSRGLSEPEIFKALKKEGYGSLEIDRAIRHSVKSELGTPKKIDFPDEESEDIGDLPELPELPKIKEKIELPEEPERLKPYEPEDNSLSKRLSAKPPADFEPEDDDIEEPRRVKEGKIRPLHIPPPKRERHRHSPREPGLSRKEAEELIEAVIGEKWDEFETKLKDLDSIFKDIDAKIRTLDNRIDKIREERDSEVEKLSQKIDIYKESITDMGSKIEGLESAMKQSLSPLMETLRSLSDTIQTLKEKHKGKK